MRVPVDASWWTSGTWEGRPIGEFLIRRDVCAVFRFLHARGVSYGLIGSLVGLSPNRAAEIVKGVRQVTAYEVLERITVGLRIPRRAMGLGRECDVPDEMAGPVGSSTDLEIAREPNCRHGAADHGLGAGMAALRQVRSELDEALAMSSVSPRQLELIEESVAEHVQIYPATAPMEMLSRLAAECTEVERLSRRRQPAAVQARLSGAAALLATMCADALMRLGEIPQARLWYRTAVMAADDSGEPRLRVLVRAQVAMLPYYFGDPRQTVSLAQSAIELSVTAFPASALAAAARARALARLGAGDAARTAMGEARRLFDDVGEADSDAAFRFPAKRLLLYLSGAATWLGDTNAAYRIQDEAQALYRSSPASLIDPALIGLDRAMCLIHDRRAVEAVATAQDAIGALPEAQRTELVLSRAANIVEAVRPAQRRGEIASLADYVRTCRAQARTLASGTAAFAP